MSISKLGIYVKCKGRITIKGHTTKVFWRRENESNIYWLSIICQAIPHFSSSFEAASSSVNPSSHFTIEELDYISNLKG